MSGGLLIGALALAHASWAEVPLLSGKPKVVDGDGLKLGAAVIRLHGIDAPELAQKLPQSIRRGLGVRSRRLDGARSPGRRRSGSL